MVGDIFVTDTSILFRNITYSENFVNARILADKALVNVVAGLQCNNRYRLGVLYYC